MMEWISVEDRLPEIPEGRHAVSVLAYVVDDCCEAGNHIDTSCMFADDIGFSLYIGTDDNGNNHLNGSKNAWCQYEEICERVTHWMPLPDPPEVK